MNLLVPCGCVADGLACEQDRLVAGPERAGAAVDERTLGDAGAEQPDELVADLVPRILDTRDEPVGGAWGAERDQEPDRIDVLEAIPDVLEARDLAQREERRQREQGGAEEEQGGLCPRPVDIAFRLDVQVTQVRILR